jgi:uncharacterized protein (TIGR00725 family)
MQRLDPWEKFKIGVFGSAIDEDEKINQKAFEIGLHIAKHGGILVTGGCPGLPLLAARGAASEKGIVLGISPAMNLEDHLEKFKFPRDPYILIFTGMEKKGRSPISLRTCDGSIFVAGRSGTLDEFLIAFDEGDERKVIGLLVETGGVVDNEIISYIKRNNQVKPTRTRLLMNDDPFTLVHEMFKLLRTLKREYPV